MWLYFPSLASDLYPGSNNRHATEPGRCPSSQCLIAPVNISRGEMQVIKAGPGTLTSRSVRRTRRATWCSAGALVLSALTVLFFAPMSAGASATGSAAASANAAWGPVETNRTLGSVYSGSFTTDSEPFANVIQLMTAGQGFPCVFEPTRGWWKVTVTTPNGHSRQVDLNQHGAEASPAAGHRTASCGLRCCRSGRPGRMDRGPGWPRRTRGRAARPASRCQPIRIRRPIAAARRR